MMSMHMKLSLALFNPQTPILIQKRHPCTGNLNSETLGDSKNAFLHWGDVLDNNEACKTLGHPSTILGFSLNRHQKV